MFGRSATVLHALSAFDACSSSTCLCTGKGHHFYYTVSERRLIMQKSQYKFLKLINHYSIKSSCKSTQPTRCSILFYSNMYQDNFFRIAKLLPPTCVTYPTTCARDMHYEHMTWDKQQNLKCLHCY